MDRRTRVLRALLAVYVLLGVVPIAWLLLSPSLALGEGGLAALAQFVEGIDFRWLLLLLVLALWLTPVAIAVGVGLVVRYQLVDQGVLDVVRDLMRERTFPVSVQVDQRLPITFDEDLLLPIKMEARVDIERDIEIETVVPIRTTLELDTTVAPNVMGLGNVKIPIRATVPVDMKIPVKLPVSLSLLQLPVAIDEEVAVRMPTIEAPINTTLDMRISLFGSGADEPATD